MLAKLVVIRGRATRKEIVLTHLPLEVGRNREAGLPIAHDHVSRNHCELFELDGKVAVRDKGSANGTFVNDQRIDDVVSLQHGDKLRIGPLTFQLVYAHGKKKVESELQWVDEIDLGKDPPKRSPKKSAAPKPESPAASIAAPVAAPAPAPVAETPIAETPIAETPIAEIVAKAAADYDPNEDDTAPSIAMTPHARPRAETGGPAGSDSALPLDLRQTLPDDEEGEESQDSHAVVNDGRQAKGGSFVTLSLDDLADDDSLVMRSPIFPSASSKLTLGAKPQTKSEPPAPADEPPLFVAPAPAAEVEEPVAPSDSGLAFFKSLGEQAEAAPAPKIKEKPAADEKKPAAKKPAEPPKEEPAEAGPPDEDDPMAFLRSLE